MILVGFWGWGRRREMIIADINQSIYENYLFSVASKWLYKYINLNRPAMYELIQNTTGCKQV